MEQNVGKEPMVSGKFEIMKTLFPGFYPYTNNQVKSFIQDSTIVLGASVLLDLYRISHWSVFLNLIKTKISQDRLWLPYDTAWLYHNRLSEVIDEQIERVKSASMYLNSFKEAIASPFSHPFISNDLMTTFESFIGDAAGALEDDKNYLVRNLKSSDLKSAIEKLFHGKIGEPYSDAQLQQLFDESKTRYENQQSPCLTLSSNPDIRIKHNRYVIWKQIQKYAKDTGKPVLLVLNRITSNWFFIFNEEVIYPRQELINEFNSCTGQSIHIITAYSFVDFLTKENRTSEQDVLLKQLHNKPTPGNTEKITNDNSTTQEQS